MRFRLLLAIGILSLLVSTSTARSAASPKAQQSPAPKFAEQALVEELVVSNLYLASQESGVFDPYGHVSARSRTNPNHYYVSRFVAPALVTLSDIIENDLDGKPVTGPPRPDQYPENILDQEVYKARPDVMAIVHLHSPEVVAFSVSSVPLGQNAAPIFGRSDEFDNPGIVKDFIAQLGQRNQMMAKGHGAVVVGNSLQAAVSGANGIRHNAMLRTQTIALGGNINPNPRGTQAPPRDQRPPVQGAGRSGPDRSWDHVKQTILEQNGGRLPAAPPANLKVAPRSKDTIKEDLVIASRILASPEIGILDSLGHVSVRNPNNPNHYFISRAVSAGSITVEDIIENDLDSNAISGPRDDEFQEIYLHGGIYKARPDVMAVIHAHTPEMVAFSQTDVALRPVYTGAAFIGNDLKNWVVGKYDPQGTIVSNPQLGKALADDLGKDTVILLAGHGIALTAPSVYDLVSYARDMKLNAQIQEQAILLGGKINSIETPVSSAGPGVSSPDGSGGGRRIAERAWEYWRQTIRAK